MVSREKRPPGRPIVAIPLEMAKLPLDDALERLVTQGRWYVASDEELRQLTGRLDTGE